jgi:Bacteriophage lambda head decoration protein D
MTSTFTEGQHRGEFIVSEGNGYISRDVGTLISGQNLKAGTVLGQITASKKWTQLATGAMDGSEVAKAILFDNIDASAGDLPAVLIAREAEVRDESTAPAPSLPAAIGVFGGIVWPVGISDPDKATAIGQLKSVGIIVRSA